VDNYNDHIFRQFTNTDFTAFAIHSLDACAAKFAEEGIQNPVRVAETLPKGAPQVRPTNRGVLCQIRQLHIHDNAMKYQKPL
jgi:hypothetical protein